MTSDFHDLDLDAPADQSFSVLPHRSRPYRCRAFRSAIAAAGAPLPDNLALAAEFAQRSDAIRTAALRKIAACEGVVDEPFSIVGGDVID